MDNNDQRNGNVPRGTFNRESAQGSEDGTHSDESAEIAGFAHAPKERKRVRTLLGVPLADALAAATGSKPEPKRDSISETIQHLLDEQSSIPIEIEDDEPTSILEAELVTELPDSSPPGILGAASTLSEFEMLPSNEQEEPLSNANPLPLLIPGPYAQLDARERHEAELGRADTLDQLERSRQHGDHVQRTTERERDRYDVEIPIGAASFQARRTTPESNGSNASIPPLVASSLAPREVSRVQPTRKDTSAATGFLMVAAMLLIAGGGWWMTAGTFTRGATSQGLPQAQDPVLPQQAPTEIAQPTPVVPPPPATPVVEVPAPVAVAVAPQPPTAADKSAARGVKSNKVASRTPRVKPVPAPAPDATGMPETPTRAEVVSRLELVRSSVRACADGRSGVADLDITIAHSGVVTHVLVGGDFAGTTQGSCIARAVREARFPTFKQERFRLLFPYSI